MEFLWLFSFACTFSSLEPMRRYKSKKQKMWNKTRCFTMMLEESVRHYKELLYDKNISKVKDSQACLLNTKENCLIITTTLFVVGRTKLNPYQACLLG